MFDFRLKVFYIVSQRLNFTKAAKELFISQPAVSKHIKEIEKHYQAPLFERKGNTLKLTPKGEVLKKYAAKIFSLYREMDAEIKFLDEQQRGILKIGSSTTAAQYVIPGYLAAFKRNYPHISLELKTNNTEKVENWLQNGKIDIGIVEGKSKRSTLDYFPFKKDEIVLCTRTDTVTKPVLRIKELSKLPFIIREKGSGTLEIIREALLKKGLRLDELRIEMVLENNESLKSYLQNSDTYAFISISAVLEELKHNKLKIIDVENLGMERYYHIATRKGVPTLPVSLLKDFLTHNPRL